MARASVALRRAAEAEDRAHGTHKCTFELESGAGELYDLVNDPEEMHDLYGDPGYRKVRRALEELMRARPGEIASALAEPIGMA